MGNLRTVPDLRRTLWGVLVLALGFFFAQPSAGVDTTMRDARGQETRLYPRPTRVVSAVLAADEILVDLIPRASWKARLRALSPLAFDPRYSHIVSRVRGVLTPFGEEMESLLELRPDLVILATYNRPELAVALERAGVRTFVLPDIRSLEDVAIVIGLLGRLTGYEVEAARLTAEFRSERRRLADLRRLGSPWAPRNGARVINYDPEGVLFASGTMFDALVAEAGGLNLASAKGLQGWSRVSAELLAGMRPDWIVVGQADSRGDLVAGDVRESAVWKHIPAAREGRLIMLPERDVTSVSHHALKAVDTLGKAFFSTRERKGKG